MKLSPEEVAHVADLARLRLTPAQIDKLTGQMNDILAHMDKLAQVDTTDVPATNHALALTGAMRDDQARPSLERARSLSNAPQSDGESFLVPRVI